MSRSATGLDVILCPFQYRPQYRHSWPWKTNRNDHRYQNTAFDALEGPLSWGRPPPYILRLLDEGKRGSKGPEEPRIRYAAQASSVLEESPNSGVVLDRGRDSSGAKDSARRTPEFKEKGQNGDGRSFTKKSLTGFLGVEEGFEVGEDGEETKEGTFGLGAVDGGSENLKKRESVKKVQVLSSRHQEGSEPNPKVENQSGLGRQLHKMLPNSFYRENEGSTQKSTSVDSETEASLSTAGSGLSPINRKEEERFISPSSSTYHTQISSKKSNESAKGLTKNEKIPGDVFQVNLTEVVNKTLNSPSFPKIEKFLDSIKIQNETFQALPQSDETSADSKKGSLFRPSKLEGLAGQWEPKPRNFETIRKKHQGSQPNQETLKAKQPGRKRGLIGENQQQKSLLQDSSSYVFSRSDPEVSLEDFTLQSSPTDETNLTKAFQFGPSERLDRPIGHSNISKRILEIKPGRTLEIFPERREFKNVPNLLKSPGGFVNRKDDWDEMKTTRKAKNLQDLVQNNKRRSRVIYLERSRKEGNKLSQFHLPLKNSGENDTPSFKFKTNTQRCGFKGMPPFRVVVEHKSHASLVNSSQSKPSIRPGNPTFKETHFPLVKERFHKEPIFKAKTKQGILLSSPSHKSTEKSVPFIMDKKGKVHSYELPKNFELQNTFYLPGQSIQSSYQSLNKSKSTQMNFKLIQPISHQHPKHSDQKNGMKEYIRVSRVNSFKDKDPRVENEHHSRFPEEKESEITIISFQKDNSKARESQKLTSESDGKKSEVKVNFSTKFLGGGAKSIKKQFEVSHSNEEKLKTSGSSREVRYEDPELSEQDTRLKNGFYPKISDKPKENDSKYSKKSEEDSDFGEEKSKIKIRFHPRTSEESDETRAKINQPIGDEPKVVSYDQASKHTSSDPSLKNKDNTSTSNQNLSEESEEKQPKFEIKYVQRKNLKANDSNYHSRGKMFDSEENNQSVEIKFHPRFSEEKNTKVKTYPQGQKLKLNDLEREWVHFFSDLYEDSKIKTKSLSQNESKGERLEDKNQREISESSYIQETSDSELL